MDITTPICPYVELTKLLSMIYSLVYGEELDISSLTISGLVKDEFTFASELHTYQENQTNTEDDAHLDYDFEQHLMECIREGKLEALKRLLRTASYNHAEIHSSNDPIRQQKNSFVILATLVTRAAIEGGFNPQVAYSLRDLYIQRVETMHSFPAILKLHREILYEVTMRVSDRKHTRGYSKLINDCCDFIDEHIREKLLVTDLAAFVGFNAHYISKKFREETGQSIKDYIKDAKVTEAKSLLKYSRLSLSEISELLSFSSQSFFTDTFRQVTGVTPAQYRKNAEK
jgi:YesN/AraC family two-component response regulator